MKINFILNDWHFLKDSSCELHYKGSFIYKGELISPDILFLMIKEIGNGVLNELDGFFAFIFFDKSKMNVIASVDLVRSIPLFYLSNDNELIFFSELSKDLKVKYEADLINKDLFILSGYVPRFDTLFKDIKQLTAGTYLNLKNSVVENVSYFRFKAIEPFKFSEYEFKEKLDAVTNEAFNKLIKFANNRQIVVPLSGGYDSRLIVTMLKYLDYNNVVCFSYGVRGNQESQYSKKIADSLGYKWFFIDYTEEKWKKNWNDDLSKQYVDFSANQVSLPHIQDWIAVMELKQKKIVEDNSIFVPGHCCVTGFISEDILSLEPNKDNVLDTLIHQHYNLCPISETSIKNKDNLKHILDSKFKNLFDYNDSVCSIAMEFNWCERQAKYIANSVRAYEFFGFDWWMPLWDKEFMKCWIEVPNTFRVDRVFFKKWVSEKYAKEAKIDFDLGNAKRPSKIYRLLQLISRLLPNGFTHKFKNLYRRNEYSRHYLGFGYIVENNERNKLSEKGYKILGIYSKKYLNGDWD